MEVHFTPDIEAQLDQLATETGRAKDEFVQDAMAGYFDELARVRETLNTRYDEIKSGKVQLIDGEEALPDCGPRARRGVRATDERIPSSPRSCCSGCCQKP